jgi:hypothetical protein
MRWIPERAEVLLHLRCIELNGDWEQFFAWGYHRWLDQMQTGPDPDQTSGCLTDSGID